MGVVLLDQFGRGKTSSLPADIANVYAARPAAAGLPNGVRFYAIDKTMEWVVYNGAWVLSRVHAPEVTSLPGAPIDQQECIFVADATAGAKWHLRYRAASASAYKWEYVGGSPLSGYVGGPLHSSGVAYADVGGPTVVVPVGGDYWVDHGATGYADNGAYVVRQIPQNASAATYGANPSGEILWRYNNQMSHQQRAKMAAINAGQTIRIVHMHDTGGQPGTFTGVWLMATPVRVG